MDGWMGGWVCICVVGRWFDGKTHLYNIKSGSGDFPGGVVVKNPPARTSLVAQWLRIRLPMQGTQLRSLVLEYPTCRGATKPMHHNYWSLRSRAHEPQLRSPRATTSEAHAPRAQALQQEKPPQ